MQRLRSLHPESNFTQIPNEAMDDLPDLNSLGLLNHLLRHRDGFDWDLKKLVKKKPGVGQRAVSKARETLIQRGYYISVKFQHNHRGQFATDVYRSSKPHAETDLAELRKRYAPGTTAQIPHKTEEGFKRDQHGELVMRTVRITWAEITSFNGVEVVAPPPEEDSQEPQQPRTENRNLGPESENRDPGPGPENRNLGPGDDFPNLGEPTPGAPDPERPKSGASDLFKKTGEEDQPEHQEEQQEAHELAAAQTSTTSKFGCQLNNADHSESVVDTQSELVGDPLHAREGEPDLTSENEGAATTDQSMTREEARAAINAQLAEAKTSRSKRDSEAA